MAMRFKHPAGFKIFDTKAADMNPLFCHFIGCAIVFCNHFFILYENSFLNLKLMVF